MLVYGQVKLFKAALQKLCRVIPKENPLEIISTVLIDVDGGVIRLSGVDREVELTIDIQCHGCDCKCEDGAVAIEAHKLFQILKGVTNKSYLKITDGKQGGDVTVQTDNAIFQMEDYPISDFRKYLLKRDVCDSFFYELQCDILKQCIDKTRFCMAKRDDRYYLTGTLFEISDGIMSIVCSDGHRMAVMRPDYPWIDNSHIKDVRVIIPSKAINELFRLLPSKGEVQVTIVENNISFKIGNNTFLGARLIDGTFPEWALVIPDTKKIRALVTTEELLNAVKGASIASSRISLSFSGKQVVVGNGEISGVASPTKSSATVECEGLKGEELFIGFESKYLLDALKRVDDPFTALDMNGPTKSLLIETSRDFAMIQFIVQPMRLE